MDTLNKKTFHLPVVQIDEEKKGKGKLYMCESHYLRWSRCLSFLMTGQPGPTVFLFFLDTRRFCFSLRCCFSPHVPLDVEDGYQKLLGPMVKTTTTELENISRFFVDFFRSRKLYESGRFFFSSLRVYVCRQEKKQTRARDTVAVFFFFFTTVTVLHPDPIFSPYRRIVLVFTGVSFLTRAAARSNRTRI
jgi:hypothetical protein